MAQAVPPLCEDGGRPLRRPPRAWTIRPGCRTVRTSTGSLMERIRDQYGVPARRGARIRFRGQPAVITGTSRSGGMYLMIRTSDGRRHMVHPTWEMDYLTGVER